MTETQYPTPRWWQERELEIFDTEEQQQEAKVRAAGEVLGFMLNVPSDSEDGRRLRSWFSPDDFPGVYALIAEAVWDDYDGYVQSLAMRMIADGRSQAIANGVVLTDLYWNASFAMCEEAAFVLSRIRLREKQFALASRAMQRLLG